MTPGAITAIADLLAPPDEDSDSDLDQVNIQILDKSVYFLFNFLISQPKYVLWVLIRTISMRQFF